MPSIHCHVDDRTFAILEREARERGRTVVDLAEAAIENEAINADADRPMPAGQRHLALESNAGDRPSTVWRDDPQLGRESTIRPGYFEGDVE